MQCRDFREVADSYLSDELLVETNHDVIAHLETCAECRRELAARREARAILRASFAKAKELRMSPEFASRLHNELRTTGTSRAMSLNSLPRAWLIAAGVIVVMTIGTIAVWQRQRAQTNSLAEKRQAQNTAAVKPSNAQPTQPDVNVDVNAVLVRMSELAAGDHRDCGIGHRLPDRPIPLEEAGRKYDRAYSDLTEALMSRAGDFNEGIELVMAHACVFRGQLFGHVVVRHSGRLVSLLVTKLEDSSRIATREELLRKTSAQVIACSSAGGFQISCFRTAQHGVFVVSDLEEGQNLALARRLAPSIYEHITNAEQVT